MHLCRCCALKSDAYGKNRAGAGGGRGSRSRPFHFRLACLIGHFRVPPGPLFQSEGSCLAFDMEIIFHSHANKTHFYKKGCAPSLILKVRVFLELGSGLIFATSLMSEILAQAT